MNSHHGLAVDGLNVGDGDLPVEDFAWQHRRRRVGISRKFGNVASVFEVDDSVDRVDPQNRSWRDLRQAELRARGGAESRSKGCFPMQP
jgi:chromosome condensin MukBEF MukE localization factor